MTFSRHIAQGIVWLAMIAATIGSPARATCLMLTPGDILIPLRDQQRLTSHKLLGLQHLERLYDGWYKDEDPVWIRRFDTGLFITFKDGTGFLYIGHDNLLCKGSAINRETINEIRALISPVVVARAPEIKPRTRFKKPRLKKPRRYYARYTRKVTRAAIQPERPINRSLEAGQ